MNKLLISFMPLVLVICINIGRYTGFNNCEAIYHKDVKQKELQNNAIRSNVVQTKKT